MPDSFRRVTIEGRTDVNVRHTDTVDVHLSGGRWALIAVVALMSMCVLFAIGDELSTANDLRAKELEIRQKELELNQRRFELDSMIFYGGKIKRK